MVHSQVSESRPGAPAFVVIAFVVIAFPGLRIQTWGTQTRLRGERETCSRRPAALLLERRFDLPDFFLGFAEVLFGFAFHLQAWVVCDFAGGLFDGAFHFMDISVDLVFRLDFIFFSPFRQVTHFRGSPRRGLLQDSIR